MGLGVRDRMKTAAIVAYVKQKASQACRQDLRVMICKCLPIKGLRVFACLASGLKRVRFAQLNKGKRTQFDPPVIPTGRRLKTSACSRFWPLFSRHFAKLSPLKLSPSRPLSDHRRESSRERFLPFGTQLSRLSKSLDPGVMETPLTP